MEVATEDETDKVMRDNQAAMEAIDASAATRLITFTWVIREDADGKKHWAKFAFTQETMGLSFGMEFQSLLTRIMRDVVKGEYGIDVGQLLARGNQIRAEMPSEINEETINNVLSSNMQYVQAFMHLLQIVPDLIHQIIALSLGVRKNRREEFIERISGPVHEGGLSIDNGVDIIKVFIRQNGGAIRRFLEDQIGEIGEELMAAIEGRPVREKQRTVDLDTSTTGGTPSSTTSPTTPEPA